MHLHVASAHRNTITCRQKVWDTIILLADTTERVETEPATLNQLASFTQAGEPNKVKA